MDNFALATRLDRALRALQQTHAGPGGAVAVLRDGAVLLRHAWGWANAERQIAFTPASLFRMCSITKQFTCALVLDQFADPAALDADVAATLRRLTVAAPTARHLCDNQSGLRDYWAVAMLHGAPAESAFGDAEAAAVIGGAQTLQFAPGSRYSYCNQNFRILSDILQARTGRGFAELLRGVFDRAGMGSAMLAADTRALPDGTEGYDGTTGTGFRPAENRIVWTGDAGLGASLDDMIAWERHIDATRDDPDSLYRRLSAPTRFTDGSPAGYGFGLARSVEHGRVVTSHGGTLRGWRSHRLHVAAERLSVVVMFNHGGDARAAALDLLAAVLDEAPAEPGTKAPPDWLGHYVEPETGLAVRLDAPDAGSVRLRFSLLPERLPLHDDGHAGNDGVSLHPAADGLVMHRPQENSRSVLVPVSDAAAQPDGLAGRYRCDELGAELLVVDAGGLLYAACTGFLGRGRMELLVPVAPDLWLMPCPRALDHTAPGDWTLAFSRDAAGQVSDLTVGCWLARGLRYARVSTRLNRGAAAA